MSTVQTPAAREVAEAVQWGRTPLSADAVHLTLSTLLAAAGVDSGHVARQVTEDLGDMGLTLIPIRALR